MSKASSILKNKIRFWKHTKYQSLLGYRENNSDLYDVALMHSSMGEKDSSGNMVNNERLEYLGDAVLETVMSYILYKKFPNKDEGFLSKTRSILVSRKTTNEIGGKLGLIDYVSTRKTINNYNIYGNMFESLIGAIFIDKGYDTAYRFVERTYHKHVNFNRLMHKEKNYKSLLLELCQKEKLEYKYELIEETRIENNRIRFQSQVLVDGKRLGLGVGNSKRESEQAAAKHALQTLKKTLN